jgi:hypothetical protein
MISLPSALMRQFEERGPIDGPSVPTNAPYVLGTDLNRSESGCRRSPLALPTEPSINNTVDALIEFSRALAPYTRYKNASSFIREGIELLLKREEEQPSGWTVRRPRRD